MMVEAGKFWQPKVTCSGTGTMYVRMIFISFWPHCVSQSSEASCCPSLVSLCIWFCLIVQSFIHFPAVLACVIAYVRTFSPYHCPLCSTAGLFVSTRHPITHTPCTIHYTTHTYTHILLLWVFFINNFSSRYNRMNWI